MDTQRLPDDLVLLRALFNEASRFLDGVEPFLAKANLHRVEQAAILAAGRVTPQQEAYLRELEANMLKDRAAWSPFPERLFRYMTQDELDWLARTGGMTDARHRGLRAKIPAELFAKFLHQPPEEVFPAPLATVARRILIDITAKLEEASRREAEPAPTPQCPIWLGEREDFPTIRGVKVPPLTVPRFKVIRAAVAAWPNGLTKDQLVTVTGQSDAVNTFKAVRRLSPEWASVLVLPGQDGRGSGYRVARE